MAARDIDLETRLSRFRGDRSDRAQRARIGKAPRCKSAQSGCASRFDRGTLVDRRLSGPHCKGAPGLPGSSCWPTGAAAKSILPSALAVRHGWSWPICPARRAAPASCQRRKRPKLKFAPPLAAGSKAESRLSTTRKGMHCAREAVRIGATALSEKLLAAPSGAGADEGVIAAVPSMGFPSRPGAGGRNPAPPSAAGFYRGLGDPWPSMEDDHPFWKGLKTGLPS